MKPIALRDITAAIGVPHQGGERMISDICTDTRTLVPGCLFVALTGENFDGHDYIAAALEKGAAFAVSHKDSPDPRVLRVADTRLALLHIAGLYRRMINPKVAAVTGSVGKTTTKEMTARVLASTYKTLKTPANLNNEIGVSQTLFMLEEDHTAAMLELGIDGPGQMSQMSVAAAPDISIVTGIGVAHLAQLGSREGIREEKMHIRDGMQDGATLLINGDNDLLRDFADSRLRILRYGLENSANDVKAENLREKYGKTGFMITWEGNRYPAQIPAMGRHNVLNAVAAFTAGVHLGVEPEKAAKALETYKPEGMRQKAVKHAGYTVVEDCYNASIDSVQAALTTLGDMPCEGKKIAVLSDMLELGATELEDHREMGRFAAQCAIDVLLCTGELSEQYAIGATMEGLEARHYPDQDALLAGILATARPGDILWFKASRGPRLEIVMQRFYKAVDQNNGQ